MRPVRPEEILSGGECQALLDRADPSTPVGARNKAMLALMLQAGLRLGEVRGLLAANASLATGRLRVIGKGRREHVVGLAGDALDALCRWADHRARLACLGGHVFCTMRGAPVGERCMEQAIRLYAERAGIGKAVNAQMLRRTYVARRLTEKSNNAR